jgi:hypothetical protein
MKTHALLRGPDVRAYVPKIRTVRERWWKYVHNEEWTNMQTGHGKCKTRQSKASSSTSYIHRYYIAVDCGE